MDKLKQYAADYNIALSPEMLEQFAHYADLLVDWNTRVNLTAITEREEICVKHFLDSLLLLQAVDIPEGAALIDVGTGAGFPGVPLKIVRGDIQLTLLDSLNKRIAFLEQLSTDLGQNTICVHGRAEELGRKPEFRERYDIATARAVAALPALCEYCLPLIKVGGCFVALKGYEVEEEVEAAAGAIRQLGAEVEAVKKLILPQDNRRSLVILRKTSQTPPKYPRMAVKITKSPL